LRTLFITASIPYPLASGGAIRTFGIIKGLSEIGHRITLISFHDDEKPAQETPLADLCEEIITFPSPRRSTAQRIQQLIFSNQADIATRFYSQAFADKVSNLAQTGDFELVQVEAIEAACYIPVVKSVNPNLKIIFDTFNAEAELQKVIYQIDRQDIKKLPKALYSLVQSQRIYQYEGDLCRMADAVIAVSPEDQALLNDYRKDDKTFIVPSGITVDDYQPPSEKLNLGEKALVFTGKMDYRPNVDAMLWFVESIWGKIKKKHTEAKLYIVGQKPNAKIQALAEQPDIIVTGWVDSVSPYLFGATIYIAPLRMGSGTRLKLLEAMASGCAIVATSIAAAGLLDNVKSMMQIADDETQFAQFVSELLANARSRENLQNQTRAAVKAHYDWGVLIPNLVKVYEEIDLG